MFTTPKLRWLRVSRPLSPFYKAVGPDGSLQPAHEIGLVLQYWQPKSMAFGMEPLDGGEWIDVPTVEENQHD